MDRSTFLSRCLNEAQCTAIGAVSAESAWLERAVEHYIQRLARLNRKTTDHLLDGRMMASKLELLKALGRARLPDEKARNEFSDLIAKIAAANADRNTVIHGLWHQGKPGKNALVHLLDNSVIAKKRTTPGNFKTMRALEIERVARDVSGALWLLMEFANRHWPTPKQRRHAKLLAAELRRTKKQPTPQGNHPRA